MAVGRRLLVLGLICAAGASIASAQQIIAGGGFGRNRVAPKWATPSDFDGSFVYCRGAYQSVRREQGGTGWWTDYPAADNNFSVRLAELTRVHIKLDASRQPNFVVVSLSDPMLFRCPMLFMEDVGTIQFTEEEVQNLRSFFLKGGFLWVDDFWGTRAWSYWTREIARVLPPSEFPIRDLPPEHAIMHTLYNVPEVPQVPSINFWYQSQGESSERGFDSASVDFKGIEDSDGRLMVLMSHNTDIADTWEREGENHEYFNLYSPRGYAIGVNVVLYSMTH